MHIKVRKETTKEGRTPSSPVLFSNLKKKERKMTRQKTTTLHKTPKPRASDTYQKNRKSKTHENENKRNKKVGAVKRRVEMIYLS